MRPSGRPNLRRIAAGSRVGSFHAGEPMPSFEGGRHARPIISRESTYRYQTFPLPSPKTPGARSARLGDEGVSSGRQSPHEETPLPIRQLGLLAILSLAEQTALNSISPYLPQMVESFPEVGENEAGLYVGILASSFALAQLSTNLLWGYLSDLVGRKLTMVLGTFLLMGCFIAFGFCRSYWQVVVVHVAMGLLNGNAAVVPTVLGEVTDRSNQSRAFTWLPVIYSLGSITGPAVGGLLVGKFDHSYPYLAPNLVSAMLLLFSVVVVTLFFEETLESFDGLHIETWVPQWLQRAWAKTWRPSEPPRRNSWSSRWPRRGVRPVIRYDDYDEEDDFDEEEDQDQGESHESRGLLHPNTANGNPDDDKDDEHTTWRQLLDRNTVLVLLTYLVFQLANISFNGLYPIFADAKPPTGRNLSPGIIGTILSVAGVATIVFQAFIFQHVKTHLGNLGTYRIALCGLAVSMTLMPWVGYRDDEPPLGIGTGQGWLYAELVSVLIIKNICAVGGLSSVMLLITNCAPNNGTLGTLNGMAQSLSAAGRSVGPFLSGALFTLSMDVQPKGEALVWGIFGGVAFVGWLCSMLIKNRGLESDDWVGNEDDEDDDSIDDESQL
ncbi:MFS general substrate transporter [Sodiomyces alkalinus F11]|uniref:MFS general substrate transporter n=1 Tax=Sodiomyces alkalinus (strain CBS 110278 / VKM F-3762 / F11) TaxID=1314773 RepID=A0A3N2Q2J1_SODAK|nr:MFS general substrate transporter [Sodiomyces alkalinus F11]ROT40970.1 MFS general substrate transporter [Sodiomyces alkalinus F11]